MYWKKTAILVVVTLALMLDVAVADNKQPTAPSEQWDPQTALWMGRAWVAEAGWGKTDIRKEEQHAIGYVLVNRWHTLSKRYPNLKLITVIRNYCAGLGEISNSGPTKRQMWVRNLFGKGEPEGWPGGKAAWKNHLPFWADTLQRVKKFASGELPNPCPGASHFGGKRAGDMPKGKMAPHECSAKFEAQEPGGTTFYIIQEAQLLSKGNL
jgi:hypothetical protein